MARAVPHVGRQGERGVGFWGFLGRHGLVALFWLVGGLWGQHRYGILVDDELGRLTQLARPRLLTCRLGVLLDRLANAALDLFQRLLPRIVVLFLAEDHVVELAHAVHFEHFVGHLTDLYLESPIDERLDLGPCVAAEEPCVAVVVAARPFVRPVGGHRDRHFVQRAFACLDLGEQRRCCLWFLHRDGDKTHLLGNEVVFHVGVVMRGDIRVGDVHLGVDLNLLDGVEHHLAPVRLDLLEDLGVRVEPKVAGALQAQAAFRHELEVLLPTRAAVVVVSPVVRKLRDFVFHLRQSDLVLHSVPFELRQYRVASAHGCGGRAGLFDGGDARAARQSYHPQRHE